MADQEAFEDELFADLYADEEPAKAPAPEPAHETPSALPPAAEYASTTVDNAQADNQNYNGEDSYMNQDDYEDEDDEVAFNLGNDSTAQYEDTPSYSAPPAAAVSAPPAKGPNAKEDGKMFIGGLNWETTDDSLRDYFSQFGEVVECTVMRDGSTGRSRGFGFLTFKDPKTVNIVMVKEHFLDGKIIDPKRAIPRDEQEKTSKIFVGGVSQETTDHEFREYFAQFGRVVDATLMMDKDTGRPRGFGFVTFESEAGVDACLDASLEIHGKPIEVKKAQPRGNLREDEEAQRRAGKFGRKGQQGNGTTGAMEDNNNQGTMNAMGGGQGNMTPQMFAQYMQRMQQAFNMMQQQMAMNRNMGSPMNPMMQMMQMQQMQQMQNMMAQAQGGRGAGGGGNPMAMNPQMMQQMQQMQQMMGQQGGGGTAGGGNGGGGPQGPGGPGNRPQGFGGGGFDPQQQQQQQQQQPQPQQQFDQQGYDQRGRQGGGYGGNQQGFNPTSWEGMYDDVPQPMMNQGGGGGGRGGFQRNRGGQFQNQNHPRDPNQAPPANAPTGPKNAGKPGANYRGGGRGGGNRGFHPYGRG